MTDPSCCTPQVGDKLVDFNESFRLFLVTRNPAPYLPPDVQPLLTIANFTITRTGLEGERLCLSQYIANRVALHCAFSSHQRRTLRLV